jgi:Tfp pilus assembly protein PilO
MGFSHEFGLRNFSVKNHHCAPPERNFLHEKKSKIKNRESKMFVNTREEFLICAVILLASGFLLYRFVVSPELKHIGAARFHLNSEQDLLKVKAEEIEHRSILNDRVQQLKTTMAEAKGIVFSRDEAMDFLRLLPQLITQTGSVLVAMKPRNMKDLPPGSAAIQVTEDEKQIPGVEAGRSFMRMPVQIAIRGRYREIIHFFEQLEERKQLMTVSEINIATAAVDPAEVDAEFTLNLYVREYQRI